MNTPDAPGASAPPLPAEVSEALAAHPRTPASEDDVSAAAPLFAALGDPHRLALLVRLSAGPASLSRLSEGAGITRQAVSRHLQVLAEVGLTDSQRAGRETLWQVCPAPMAQARAALDQLSHRWDARLARLKHLVESD